MSANATNDLSIASALGSTIQYRIENNLYLGRAIGGLLPVAWLYSSRDPGYQYYYSDLALNASPQERFIKAWRQLHYFIIIKEITILLIFPIQKILAFARQNRFHLEGFVYEESLIDEAVELDPANYITKISIPFTAAHPILNEKIFELFSSVLYTDPSTRRPSRGYCEGAVLSITKSSLWFCDKEEITPSSHGNTILLLAIFTQSIENTQTWSRVC